MVTCKDFLRELSDYLDEHTDHVTRAELEVHITQCPNCWVLLDTTKKTIEVYKGMEPQPLPERVRTKLIDVLRQRCTKRSGPVPPAQA